MTYKEETLEETKIPSIDSLIIERGDIKEIEMEVPDYSYGASQEPLNAEFQVRNIPKTDGGDIKYCFATISTDEVTTSGTSKTLTLNTFDTNDNGMSVTNSRITITAPGLYMISGAITFASNATGAREILLRKNGTTNTNMHYQANQSAGDLTSCVFNRYMNYITGDYIEVRAYQTSGGNLNVTSNTQRTFLQAVKIG